MSNIEKITKDLLIEIGEDPDREGLLKTPLRVSKSWKYLTKGYQQNIEDIVNGAIFHEESFLLRLLILQTLILFLKLFLETSLFKKRIPYVQ